MMPTNDLERNMQYIQGLQPRAQWAGMQWVKRCWDLNILFRIVSGHRTAEQQHALWQRGRDRNGRIVGKVVTNIDGYTVKSDHQSGLAVDVFPLNCSYKDIADVAAQYGITQPYTKKPWIDLPHLSFNSAVQMPVQGPRPIKSQIRRYQRQLEASRDVSERAALLRKIRILEARLERAEK